MQYQAPEHEIRKRPRLETSSGQRVPVTQQENKAEVKAEEIGGGETNSPLMTDGSKLGFVFRVRLDAQAGREDELADRGAEAGEEGVEGLGVFAREDVSIVID